MPPGRASDTLEWRPPLTDGLVAQGARTRELLNGIPDNAASGLVAELRRRLSWRPENAPLPSKTVRPVRRPHVRAGGLTLEAALDDMSKGRSTQARDFIAFRLYLQDLLRRCSLDGVAEVGGVTNQVLLVRTIEEWRSDRNEPVLYVTFNYDTILDQALTGEFGWTPQGEKSNLRTYFERDDFKLFKLHGSWNWRQITAYPSPFRPSDNSARWSVLLRRALLDHASDITRNLYVDDYRYASDTDVDRYTYGDGPTLALPALAIPLGSKATFTCSRETVEELQRCLPKVDHILTIGWKAGEPSFVEMLRQVQTGTDLFGVEPYKETLQSVASALLSAGVPLASELPNRAPSFSRFVDGPLQKYLRAIS